MEFCGVLVSLVECILPRITKHWEYHRDFNKNTEALRIALDILNCRKTDIRTKLHVKVVQGETEERSEVMNWLERVEKICQECEDIENKIRDVKFFSRASLGKKVAEKKVQVDELYQEGEFSEGDLVKTLQRRGNVLPTTRILEGETTFNKKMEEIWGCLLDDKVTKIGVHGMGGIGKTTALKHINNRLLKEKDKFDKVIWVTVSNDSDIRTLQGKIAYKLELDISKVDDEKIRAEELCKSFLASKRYVLILDDMWNAEHNTLEKVGVPDPTSLKGCKLVLTTRSLDVCHKMSCGSVIEMIALSEKEALDLFLEKVGPYVSSNPKLKELVEKVALECARLPLAIVVIAGSLRNKIDPYEWETALVELQDATTSMSSTVMSTLRLSYDWLEDKRLKDCLLYCALYSEDYPIQRNLLIDQLIADGIVEGIRTRQYQIGKGQVMLNKLVSLSLLNDMDSAFVRMHDLIRDMAIQIMRNDPRFLVRTCDELKSIPDKKSWNEDLEKVSLMGNNIVEFSSNTEPPKCSKISTLFLTSNSHLKSIPNEFFQNMRWLHVLNLSDTSIEELPRSVSDLVSLAVLMLRRCTKLTNVPSLGKLENMMRLDFYKTGIKKVPEGIGKLSKLTYLNLSRTMLESIPDGILCKLTNLQYLSIVPSFEQVLLRSEELDNMRKLETLHVTLADVNSFNECIGFFEGGELTDWKFRRGSKVSKLAVQRGDKRVILENCYIRHESAAAKASGFPLLLPKNVEFLCILGCRVDVSSLCQLTPLEYTTNLKKLVIQDCDIIEHLFDYSSRILPLLQRLQALELRNLRDLRGLVDTERSSSPLPPISFSSLERLELIACHKVKKLLILNDVSFPNLEVIDIEDCEQLEEIILRSSSENDPETPDNRTNANTITLPILRVLHLDALPNLKSIPLVADSLQEIQVYSCPKIKRIPLLDREPCPPSLRLVSIDRAIWDTLEWDHPIAKDGITNIVPIVRGPILRAVLRSLWAAFSTRKLDWQEDEDEDDQQPPRWLNLDRRGRR